MTPTATILLLIGLGIFARIGAYLLSIGAFNFRLKPQPPAVRLHPDLLKEWRSEIVHHASKRIVRADFNRSFK